MFSCKQVLQNKSNSLIELQWQFRKLTLKVRGKFVDISREKKNLYKVTNGIEKWEEKNISKPSDAVNSKCSLWNLAKFCMNTTINSHKTSLTANPAYAHILSINCTFLYTWESMNRKEQINSLNVDESSHLTAIFKTRVFKF